MVMFFDMKGKDIMFPQVNDKNLNTDLAFFVDILGHQHK